MTRRAAGTVYRIPDRKRKGWRVMATLTDTASPEQKRVSLGLYDTKKQAEKALQNWLADPWDPDEELTLQQAFDRFEATQLTEVTAKTLYDYHRMIRDMAAVSGLNVRQLTVTRLQQVLNAACTVKSHAARDRQCLCVLFDWLVRLGFALRNPARDLVLSGFTNTSRKYVRRAFDDEEIRTLEENRDDARVGEACRLCLFLIRTGLRHTEFRLLKKKDIDLEHGIIHVRQSKTEAGVRDIPIASSILPEARQLAAGDPEEYAWLSRTWPAPVHGPRQKIFVPLSRYLGISHLPYDTRHTFATRLVMQGCPEPYIQKLMGHASSSVLTSFYTHIDLALLAPWVEKV